jgi:hypothetical protein
LKPETLTADRPGSATRTTVAAIGRARAASPAARQRHPWLTTPSWNPLLAKWTATVDPGFVNEQCPVCVATGGLPLYCTPNIPLDFYALGFDGSGNYPVPDFFLQLGAAAAPAQPSAQDIENGADLNLPPPPEGLRLLRACDLWVHQPRLALSSDITVNPSGVVTGQSLVAQTLTVQAPAPGDVLEVLQGTYVPDTQTPNALSGDYTEPNFDEIALSTVFLLSAPNTPPGSAIDGSWTPYVRHNLFWNLSWAQPTFAFQPPQADIGLEALSFLGAGSAATVINGMAASLNDATNAAINIIDGNSLAGSFWTPTGGGSDARVTLLSTTIAPVQGPNIYLNLANQLAAQRAAQLAVQLDPDFPYTGLPFPLSLALP